MLFYKSVQSHVKTVSMASTPQSLIDWKPTHATRQISVRSDSDANLGALHAHENKNKPHRRDVCTIYVRRVVNAPSSSRPYLHANRFARASINVARTQNFNTFCTASADAAVAGACFSSHAERRCMHLVRQSRALRPASRRLINCIRLGVAADDENNTLHNYFIYTQTSYCWSSRAENGLLSVMRLRGASE